MPENGESSFAFRFIVTASAAMHVRRARAFLLYIYFFRFALALSCSVTCVYSRYALFAPRIRSRQSVAELPPPGVQLARLAGLYCLLLVSELDDCIFFIFISLI